MPSTAKTNAPRYHRSVSKGKNIFQNLFIYIFMFLLFLIPPSLQKHQGFNITEISNNQGLYFDKISQFQCIRNEWKLILYYNMSTYWQSINNIHNYILYMQKTYKSETDKHFESIILQLEHELDEIDHYNIILSNNQNIRRQKRGLVNGVGYIANTLFGVLDERFAEQYQKDIETIRFNENHLHKLIHNQTIIMEAESNILQRHEYIMNKSFTLIEQHINSLKLDTDRIRIDTNNGIYFSLSALTSHIIISKIKSIQQMLIDTMTDIYQGHISTRILLPEQLQKQINIISGQLHGDLVLPVDRSNIMQLYKLLRASARITDKYLIIEIKTPLLGSDIYELDKIIGVPQKRNNQYYNIISNFPYIGFNVRRDSVIFLSEFDLSSCRHLSEEKLLCSLDKPVYDINIKQSICDIKLINSGTSLSPCSSEVSSCRESWIKLHADNSWLFACCEECAVRIICPDRVSSKQLRGNGVLHLGSMCTMKGTDFTIYAHNNFINKINISDNIEFPEVSILNKLINTSSIRLNTQLRADDQDKKWLALNRQIAELKEQSRGELSVHHVHHYALGYIITGLLLLVSGVVAFQRLRARCRQRVAAPPAGPSISSSHDQRQPREAAHPADSDSASEVVVNVRHVQSVPIDIRESVLSVDKATSPMANRSIKFEVPSE